MSRNIRQKYPRTPVQATKRRGSDSSTPSLSGEDGYSVIDDLSDSEDDDEEGVDAAEAEHIVTDEVQSRLFSSSPRPSDSEDEDADGEDEDDDDENDYGADENESWNGIVSNAENLDSPTPGTQASTPVKRQVRFAGVPDSDSDSDSTTTETTEDNSAFFPDIFVNQASLDPSFRREIEQETDSSSGSSYWDFHDTYGQMGHLIELSSDDEDAADANADAATPVQSGEEDHGFDAEGETTEEDTPEPRPPRIQLRRSRSVSDSSDSEAARANVPRLRRRPRAARFDLDDTNVKPVAFVHPGTKKLIIVTPERSRGFDLAPECFRGTPLYLPHSQFLSSPITSHSGGLMMSAMVSSSTFGDIINSLPFGPLEAYMPPTSPNMECEEDSDDSAMFAEQDDGESGLKIEDFIKFHDEDSADEGASPPADSPDWSQEVSEEPAATPDRRPSTALSEASDVQMEMHPLTVHFENNCDVGAFRRDQVNRQLITSKAVSSDSLAFSGPLSIGTLKGIKGGSLDAVKVPLTPVRKQKRGSMDISQDNNLNKGPLEAMAQKRKASSASTESMHKRHRSISEVGTIAL